MNPKILIRADGSPLIGLGHLVRCSALAYMLKDDFEITFICRDIPDDMLAELNNNSFSCIRIENEDEFFNQLNNNTIAVLDGYHFDTCYQRQIKAIGSKLICIDDLHDKEFYADLIINHAPGIKPQDYLAQPYTQFALGLEYALLRPAFLKQAKKLRKIEKIETLMICFGGSDYRNLTESTLQVIMGFKEFQKIIVVTGPSYNQSASINLLKKKDKRIVHLQSLDEKEMHYVMIDSDVTIVSSSGILLEAICCGCIPLICFYTENQKEFHSYMNNVLGLNSFGNNTEIFLSENLKQQLKSIKLKNNQGIANIRKIMSDSSVNLLKLFHSLSK